MNSTGLDIPQSLDELLIEITPKELNGLSVSTISSFVNQHIKNHEFDKAREVLSANIQKNQSEISAAKEEILDYVPDHYNLYDTHSPKGYVRKARNGLQILKRVSKVNKQMIAEGKKGWLQPEIIDIKLDAYFLKESEREELLRLEKELRNAELKDRLKRTVSRYSPKFETHELGLTARRFAKSYGTALGVATLGAGLGFLAYGLLNPEHAAAINPEIINANVDATIIDLTDKLDLAKNDLESITRQYSDYKSSLENYVVQKGDSISKIIKSIGEKASHQFSAQQIADYADSAGKSIGKMTAKGFEIFVKGICYTPQQITTSPFNPNFIIPGQELDLTSVAEKADLFKPYTDTMSSVSSEINELTQLLDSAKSAAVSKTVQTTTHVYNAAQMIISGAIALVGAGITGASEYVKHKIGKGKTKMIRPETDMPVKPHKKSLFARLNDYLDRQTDELNKGLYQMTEKLDELGRGIEKKLFSTQKFAFEYGNEYDRRAMPAYAADSFVQNRRHEPFYLQERTVELEQPASDLYIDERVFEGVTRPAFKEKIADSTKVFSLENMASSEDLPINDLRELRLTGEIAAYPADSSSDIIPSIHPMKNTDNTQNTFVQRAKNKLGSYMTRLKEALRPYSINA